MIPLYIYYYVFFIRFSINEKCMLTGLWQIAMDDIECPTLADFVPEWFQQVIIPNEFHTWCTVNSINFIVALASKLDAYLVQIGQIKL